jgi:hypothetical protein
LPAPVWVKLKRVNSEQAIPYPPDAAGSRGMRLKNAFACQLGLDRGRHAPGGDRKRSCPANGLHPCRSNGRAWQARRWPRHRWNYRRECLRGEPAARNGRPPAALGTVLAGGSWHCRGGLAILPVRNDMGGPKPCFPRSGHFVATRRLLSLAQCVLKSRRFIDRKVRRCSPGKGRTLPGGHLDLRTIQVCPKGPDPSGLRPASFVMSDTPVEVQFTSAGCLNYPCRTPGRLSSRGWAMGVPR